ncbi:MAG: aminotransferase class V-fold PLP-dependent enzyme [Planctomycetaceae bacterium]|nr:aminotransferase class V-fold PLP-dependent enzyme [Planctomycetaceae bacterium]
MLEPYTFKIAEEAWELEQINALNYEAFVEEIPQHASNTERKLVDTFHSQNRYVICVQDRQVMAMLAVRPQRPFSLDRKLAELDSYLPTGRHLCEVRLLAARRPARNSRIVRGLIARTVKYCIDQGYDTAVISGILQQVRLYRHLGFVPFGPIVGNNGVRFQPMYLTIEGHAASRTSFIGHDAEPVNLLPGPVAISAAVRRALEAPPLSHRSREYLELHRQTQARLCELTGAKHVQILTGSGTLANEAVAAQLSLLEGKGLILSNGEFGERLIEQARSYGLHIETLSLPWGQEYRRESLDAKIGHTPGLSWIWAVLSESSTGMLNNPEMLNDIANEHGLRLCLDCVSAIGNTAVDLRNVYLASACSSKGLRSVAGLALVFYNHALHAPMKPIPVYLDLCRYEKSDGVPFTIASNATGALAAALNETDFAARFARIRMLDTWLRARLNRLNLRPLVSEPASCPGIITIPLPEPMNSKDIGDRLKDAGFLISYESRYLLQRNWIQVCLMSEVGKLQLRAFVDALKSCVAGFRD